MKQVHMIFVVILMTFMTGCFESTDESAVISVTGSFWGATKANNVESLKKFVTKDSIKTLEEQAKEDAPRQAVEFSTMEITEVQIHGERATAGIIMGFGDGDDSFELVFETSLMKENNEWKVDLEESGQAFGIAYMKVFADQFTNAFQGLAEDLGETMQEGIEELVDVFEEENTAE